MDNSSSYESIIQDFVLCDVIEKIIFIIIMFFRTQDYLKKSNGLQIIYCFFFLSLSLTESCGFISNMSVTFLYAVQMHS